MFPKTMISHLLLLLQLSTIMQFQLVTSYDLRRSSRNFKLQVVDEENSPALNNFLEDVLKAKDELKWIDRTINAGDHSYQSRSSKRRLLWSRKEKNSHSRYKRHGRIRNKDDQNFHNIAVRNAANEGDIDTILDDLGFSGENSPGSRSIQDNSHVESRRYPIPDLTGTGIIEYYDYEGDLGKRDSLDASNSNVTTRMSNEFETVKKERITEEKDTESSTHSYPKQEFISDRVELPKAKKYVIDLNDQENEEGDSSNVELINDVKDGDRVGLPDRCHRVKDDRENDGMLLHSHFLEIQEFEVIPAHSVDNNNQLNLRSTKAINPGRTFFILSPVNSLEENNSMTSGSDYHALKVTDDMFKGGIEQGNSFDESPSIHFNSKDIENDNHWKSIPDTNQQSKTLDELRLQRKNVTPNEIHSSTINKAKPESNKESRGKRSSGRLGPIMRHESIVEPFNWPWEDYDSNDNTKIRFGRELMQASDTNPIITKFTTSQKILLDISSSGARPQDTLQDSKVFWRSRALTYLHKKRHQPFFKGNEKFLKNHSTPFGTRKRVKRDSDGVTRVGKFVGKLSGENSGDESQMGLAVHGEIAEKIVDKIFEQVQKNEHLKTTLGSGLYRRPKSGGQWPTEKESETADRAEIKRTDEIMKKVMELLGHLVSNEVHRKSCTKLPPHLREFLVWMVGDEEESRDTTESPVTAVHNKHEKEKNLKPTKFLFPSTQRPESEPVDPNDLYRKVRLLKSLIKEYHALTEKEQTKVQTVYDYLERQLHLLLKYIALKEAAKRPSQIIKRKNNVNNLYYHSTLPKVYEDDHELLELRLKSNPFGGRIRRQVERHWNNKKKKRRKKNKKKRKHKKKKQRRSHKIERHLRSKRSAHEEINWEIPKIFYPSDINFLSNISTYYNPNTSSPLRVTTVDDELYRLFKGTRVSEFTPQNDKFGSKSNVITSPFYQTLSPFVIVGSDPKTHTNELLNLTKSSTNSIRAASLTTEENSHSKNDIKNSEDNSRNLNSLKAKINVFPIS